MLGLDMPASSELGLPSAPWRDPAQKSPCPLPAPASPPGTVLSLCTGRLLGYLGLWEPLSVDPQITKHGADLDPRASLSVMHPVTWAVHLLEQAQGSFGPGPPHGASGGGRQLPVCSPGRRGSEPHQALVSQVEWGSHRALVRLAPQNQATLVNGSLHPIQMGFEFPAGGKTGSRRGGGGVSGCGWQGPSLLRRQGHTGEGEVPVHLWV